jgi:hypothetical protein
MVRSGLARRGRDAHDLTLGLVSIEMVAMRLPRLSLQYLNFGSADTRRVRDRFVEAQLEWD